MENLIKAALADGALTEKERCILFRNAQEEGIELDEFEMVLEARMFERGITSSIETFNSSKNVGIKKCPACASIRVEGVKVCPDCGFKFMSPLQELIKELNEAEANAIQAYNRKHKNYSSTGGLFSSLKQNVEKALGLANISKQNMIEEYKKPIIENFTIPADPEELLEAMAYFDSHIDNSEIFFSELMNYKSNPIYRKQKEMIAKGKLVYAKDKSKLKQIKRYEENLNLNM